VSQADLFSPAGVERTAAGVLVERAVELLRERSRSTDELAREVLGVRGPAAIAAQAIWTLLAGDPRFLVSRAGEWSIRVKSARPPASLADHEWIVVDVETTGGTPRFGHRVTEVAAVRVRGGRIHDVYSTLINPGRPIPRAIVSLTGITNEMVEEAPRFREVATRLVEVLRGGVFVAHNAAFDWRFVCSELELCGEGSLRGPQLCTVRVARKLLPQLSSRSLGSLIQYFGLSVDARHRAEDDAVATARLLLRFFEMLGERGIEDWAALQAFLRKPAPRRPRRAAPRSMRSE
jgi:DNA polymerase III subunit epsilon